MIVQDILALPTELVESILKPLKSRYVYLSWKEHDMVTANTQAVTHAAFLRWVQDDTTSTFC